jgi:homoaconitase/3-isopropylmalate dehydratase large subunit
MDESSELLENLKTDKDAIFDSEINIKADDIEPMIHGTNPEWELYLKVSQCKSSSGC